MDLTNDIKTDLNGASLFFPSVCLICPPHSSYYTRTMSGPWWIPAAFTPAPFRWTFQRDRFMEMSSCNFSFRMCSSKTAWQLFSSDNIFSSTLRKKVVLFIHLKSCYGELPIWPQILIWGNFRLFCFSLFPKQACRGESGQCWEVLNKE